MTWLANLKRGDSVMVYTPNAPPKKKKVMAARRKDNVIRIAGMPIFYADTGTTPGDRYSLGPPPSKPLRTEEEREKSERIYLATRVRNASTHELTTDQLRRLVGILDELMEP